MGLCIDGGLAQGLGDVLMGALLVAAQIEDGVRVAGDGFPGVLVQLLDLGHVLNDGAGGNVAGTHGGQFTSVPWQRHSRKLIQYKVDVPGQRPMMDLVRAVIKRLKRLGIEQGHQEIEGVVIVRDHGVESAFLFSQGIEVHIVVVRDGPDLGQVKGGQTNRGGDQNTLGCLARALLEYFVLPQSHAFRVLPFYGLKQ